MICYVKSMAAWEQLLRPTVLSYTLPVFSGGADTGTVTLVGETNDYTGDWLILAGMPYVIKSCKPANGQTSVTVQLPEYAFSRALIYTGQGPETYGDFIASALETEYVEQADPVYAMPYLTVSNLDHTAFDFPAAANASYSLADIIRQASAAGVYCAFTPGVSGLAVAIAARSPAENNLFFGDGHTQLSQQTYTSSILAKVTVRETSTDRDTGVITVLSTGTWYWWPDGTVRAEPPAPRISGEWRTVDVKEGSDLQAEAEKLMGKNTAGYKVEFYSDKDLRQNDVVICRIGSIVIRAVITFRRISSSDRRIFYRAGTAAVTLTDKISAGSGGSSTVYIGGGGGGLPPGGTTGQVLTKLSDAGQDAGWRDLPEPTGGGVTIDTLWTNPSPTASFAAQTVAVDLTGYDAVGIVTKISTGSSNLTGMEIFMIDTITGTPGILPYTGSNGQAGRRTARVLDDLSGVNFSAATIDGSTANGYILPYKIYGIKL